MSQPLNSVPPTAHRGDQLVVALPYQRLVLAEVQRIGLSSAREVDTSAALDLGLIGFDQSQLDAWQGQAGVAASTSIDALLATLRSDFARQYNGWSPTLGKNRFVGHVDGFHVIGGWDENDITSLTTTVAYRSGSLGAGVLVGLADTALYPAPWLAGGYHATEDSLLRPDLGPDHEPDGRRRVPFTAGHATFIAGLILRHAAAATIEARQCLDDRGEADSWQAAQALVEVGRSGVDLVNISWGCRTEDGQPPLILAAAVDRLPDTVVVVAAAGNFGNAPSTQPDAYGAAWPAALDDVVAVGALASDGTPAPFSPQAPWVDLMAPGIQLTSTYLDGRFSVREGDASGPATSPELTGFAKWSGTSFSAACITGRIASKIRPGQVDARAALALVREEPANIPC